MLPLDLNIKAQILSNPGYSMSVYSFTAHCITLVIKLIHLLKQLLATVPTKPEKAAIV